MGMMTAGNGMKIDLLWENPNPQNSFSPQTIQIPNIMDYDIIRIYAYAQTTLMGIWTVETFAKLNFSATVSYTGWDSQAVTHDRRFTVTAKGLSVEDGHRAGIPNNIYVIPYRIYGIKF